MKRIMPLCLMILAVVCVLCGCGAEKETPVLPVDVPGASYVAGTINITDAETMEVRGMYVNEQTIEVSSDTAEELADFFNGRELTGGESPACACDLAVETDEWKIWIHTECGSVMAHADGIDGYTELTVDEIKELSDILAVYDLRTEFADG